MDEAVRETISKEQQPYLINGDRTGSSLDVYTNGIKYVGALMSGLGQMSLFMLAHYAQPKPFPVQYKQPDGLIKLYVGPADGRSADDKSSITNYESILSPMKQYIESNFVKNAPSVLRTMLEFMCLAYSSNFELRKHLKNIRAIYLFRFKNYDTQIALEMNKEVMRVFRGNIDQPDVILTFNDSEALRKLFFSVKPDILDMMLKQDIVTDGNLVYMYKFMYMLRHLRTKLIGPA